MFVFSVVVVVVVHGQPSVEHPLPAGRRTDHMSSPVWPRSRFDKRTIFNSRRFESLVELLIASFMGGGTSLNVGFLHGLPFLGS